MSKHKRMIDNSLQKINVKIRDKKHGKINLFDQVGAAPKKLNILIDNKELNIKL